MIASSSGERQLLKKSPPASHGGGEVWIQSPQLLRGRFWRRWAEPFLQTAFRPAGSLHKNINGMVVLAKRPHNSRLRSRINRQPRR